MKKDYFSNHASQYATFRPIYPNDLYAFLFSQLKSFNAAWDCGTGNGQVAHALSNHFKKVFATDISQRQLEHALKSENIFYSVTPSEKTPFENSSFDLITVGQAIHWFHLEEFYKEVNRVGKSGSLLAAWGYSLIRVNPQVDDELNHFYKNVVGPYWDSARQLVDLQYKTIPFPFMEIKTPSFEMSFSWSIDQFIGYINTWSAVKKYISLNQVNPTNELREKLKPFWNNSELLVRFPLFIRVGRI